LKRRLSGNRLPRRLSDSRVEVFLSDEALAGIKVSLGAFLDVSPEYITIIATYAITVGSAIELDVDFEVSAVGDTTVAVAETLQEASEGGGGDFVESFNDAMEETGIPATTTGAVFEPPVVTYFSLDAYDFGCTLGLACAITLSGYPANATTDLLVLDSGSCADDGATLVNYSGLLARVDAQTVGLEKVYDLGTATVGTPRSDYQLCFGINATDITEYNISNASFALNGPNVAEFECSLGAACVLTPTGKKLMSTNEIFVTRNTSCSNATVQNFSDWKLPRQASFSGCYELGTTLDLAGPDENYTLCWAHDPADLADFVVTLGVLNMAGPISATNLTCTLGKSCLLNVTGVLLTTDNGAAVASVCGEDVAWDGAWYGGSQLAVAVSAGRDEEFFRWRPVSGVPATNYSLCWGPAPNFPYPGASEYLVDLGANATLYGPDTTDAVCTLGLPCVVNLTGLGLAESNEALIIQADKKMRQR
jgi:hypothetical protein